MSRSSLEKIFIFFFIPLVFLTYIIKSYPGFLTNLMGIEDPYGTYFFLWGKTPNFWYQTIYTAIVVGICIKLLFLGRNPYSKKSKPLSKYQKYKFISILLAQFIGFYLIPFVAPMIKSGVWNDRPPQNIVILKENQTNVSFEYPINYSPDNLKFGFLLYADGDLIDPSKYRIENYKEGGSFYAKGVKLNSPLAAGTELKSTAFHLVHKYAHVYLSPAFFSTGAFLYMFLLIPILVWFFGKRYCSWICACGNLAETIGTTKWGARWVKEGTPRSKSSISLEKIQGVMLIFSAVVGFSAILNVYHVISPGAYDRLWYVQDFVTDFMFGSIIGIVFYPFFGTRMWCRYGCPMAGWMKIFGRYSRSKFEVVPHEKCIGIGLCTKACPMGINVASFAHVDKKPIQVSFGLEETPCIGCGGCIDSCPVDALAFRDVGNKTFLGLKEV